MRYLSDKLRPTRITLSRIFRTTTVILFGAYGVLTALHVRAQSTNVDSTPRAAFEVISIRPNHSDNSVASQNWGADRFTATNVTVHRLIAMAYGAGLEGQILGAPSWINTERYDINAKIDDIQTKKMQDLPLRDQAEQLKPMLQSLLVDRFQLTVTHETKDFPVFALVVAKNGSKLTPTGLPPSDLADPQIRTARYLKTPDRGRLIAKGQPASALLAIISKEVGGRSVLDETGLKGEFDFQLQWTTELNTPANLGEESQISAATQLPTALGPSIFTALDEQLGLKLGSRKAPKDVVIVVHIDRPSGN